MPSSKKIPPTPPAPQHDLAALVATAIESLDALESALKLDIVIRRNDKAQAQALNRVPLAALRLASSIVAGEPGRFHAFSALPGATSYVETMAPLAARIHTLGNHVDSSIRNQHAPAAQQTLVLYGVVKSLGRIASNQTMRETLKTLQAAIVPRRRITAPKQTHAQKMAKQAARRLAVRVAKAKAIVAAGEPTGVVHLTKTKRPAPT